MTGYRPEGLHTGLETDDDGVAPGQAAAGDPGAGEEAAAAAAGPATRAAGAGPGGSAVVGPNVSATAPKAWGVREWGRWMWRQLTSMRTALLLLTLLAVAALPGAYFPQRNQDPARVAQYYADNPSLAATLDRWSLFDVYTSPWFAAIYLLLFISLIGCIVPRTADHVRALRRPPPRAPRRFARFENRAAFASPLAPDAAAEAAESALRGYRVRRDTDGGLITLSAERGYLRETGNIVFHLALVGLLVSVAYGSLVHYRGQVLVVQGETFANSQLDYDSFDSGAWFDPDSLTPFRMRLDEFTSVFDEFGQARDFTAEVTVTEPGAEPSAETIKVNHPLRVGSANVFLMGNGFAPRVQVHDGEGNLAFSGAVPFIPAEEVNYDSRGVIKVPDTSSGVQLGLNGSFLPTGVVGADGTAFSISPELNDPVLVLEVWYGDLGLDEGVPQNVYQLDTDGLTQVTETAEDGTESAVRIAVRPGATVELPEGLGTITFVDVPRFVGLDLRYDPTLPWVLVSSLLMVAGLMASLFTPRRRVFVRIGTDDGAGDPRTVVTAAALARGDDPGLGSELARITDPLREDSGAGAPETDEARRRVDG